MKSLTPTHRFNRRHRRASRGFTLMEMLAGMVIIALLAALAIPAFTRRLKDRKTYEAARGISMIFRNARARALGRGAAHLVRYDNTQLVGRFRTLEAVQTVTGASSSTLGTCGPLPVTSCLNTNWNNANTARQVDRFPNISNNSYADVRTLASVDNANTIAQFDICFTPSGRTFWRPGPAAVWQNLMFTPSFQVQRIENGIPSGLRRTVLLPPSGAARLAL